MTERDAQVFLTHILESIEAIEGYTRGTSEKEFLAAPLVQDGVVRRLEVIGEAVKNLPDVFRETHPEVPWKRLAGLRDVLIHRYFAVDLELTWELVKDHIPTLKQQIKRLLEEVG